MNAISEFLTLLESAPKQVRFADTMQIIDSAYDFNPSPFTNGDATNAAGENQGSCKIFAFGKLHRLSEKDTLACFGENYCSDVVEQPKADNHSNIRNFMKYGWEGIRFEDYTQVLIPKSC